MDNYVSPLRYWCFKVLPLVYDDSLSYYEVVSRVAQKMNEVVDAINANSEQVDAIDAEVKSFILNMTESFNNFQQSLLTRQENYENKVTAEWNEYRTEITNKENAFEEKVNSDFQTLSANLEGDIANWEADTQEALNADYEAKKDALQKQIDGFFEQYKKTFGVVQNTGESTENVMSQNAVTLNLLNYKKELTEEDDAFNLKTGMYLVRPTNLPSNPPPIKNSAYIISFNDSYINMCSEVNGKFLHVSINKQPWYTLQTTELQNTPGSSETSAITPKGVLDFGLFYRRALTSEDDALDSKLQPGIYLMSYTDAPTNMPSYKGMNMTGYMICFNGTSLTPTGTITSTNTFRLFFNLQEKRIVFMSINNSAWQVISDGWDYHGAIEHDTDILNYQPGMYAVSSSNNVKNLPDDFTTSAYIYLFPNDTGDKGGRTAALLFAVGGNVWVMINRSWVRLLTTSNLSNTPGSSETSAITPKGVLDFGLFYRRALTSEDDALDSKLQPGIYLMSYTDAPTNMPSYKGMNMTGYMICFNGTSLTPTGTITSTNTFRLFFNLQEKRIVFMSINNSAWQVISDGWDYHGAIEHDTDILNYQPGMYAVSSSNNVKNLPDDFTTSAYIYLFPNDTGDKGGRTAALLFAVGGNVWVMINRSWVRLQIYNQLNADILKYSENGYYTCHTSLAKPYNFPNKKIIVFGDSISVGQGGSDGQTWQKYISEINGFTFENHGVAGAAFGGSEQFNLENQTNDVNFDGTDMILIAGGINNASSVSTTVIDKIKTGMTTMINTIRGKTEAPIVFITPIRCGDKALANNVPKISACICNTALANHCGVINGYDFAITTDKSDFYEDFTGGNKIHPNNDGYYAYALGVMTALF